MTQGRDPVNCSRVRSESSPLPLQKWAWAIYLELTNFKGVSSMKLHRELGVRQATAWFMLHRIREAFADVRMALNGPVEVDETYVGGLRKNMSTAKQKELDGTGRGPGGQTGCGGDEGPGDGPCRRAGHRQDGRRDPTGFRG